MDPRAMNIINQVSSLSTQFGVPVTVNRVLQATTPIRNVFGTPTNATPQIFTANVIIESEKIDLMATLAGGKPKEVLKLITNAGTFFLGDELVYGGHTYKVEYMQPVPFIGSDVVDFVHASREVV